MLSSVTYRDDLLVLRERWRDDRDRRDRAVRELGPRVAAIREAEARLDHAGIPLAFRVSEASFAPIEAPPEDAPREVWEAAMVRLSQQLEEIDDEARWLDGRRESLANGVDRAPLGAPPRAVPLRLVLAECLGLSFRVAFVALPLAITARATLGRLGSIGMLALFGVVVAFWTSRRIGFLRHGVLAQVRVLGRRASGSDMTNWPMRRARGWAVDSISFTGNGTVTELAASVEGREVALRLRDVVFEDGLVLVRGTRAIATVSLHSAPVPTPEGAWAARLTPIARRSVLFGVLAWVAMLALVRF